MITFEASSDRGRECYADCRPIDFNEIFNATRLEPDTHAEAPWHDDDGWKHDFTPASQLADKPAGLRQSLGWVRGSSYTESGLITIDAKTIKEWVGSNYGMSKQVYAERCAEVRRKSIEQLKKWYTQGWEVWGVVCDFRDGHASLWGIHASIADDYLGECRREIACQVAHNLQKNGHVVIDMPPWQRRPNTREQRQRDLQGRFACNLGFGWDGRDLYREWLMSRPRKGGWPKKNETARIYREKDKKSYFVVFPRDGRFLGTMSALAEYAAGTTGICTGSVTSGYISANWLKRMMWSELPKKWREAFRPRLDIPPCDTRGFWRVR